MLDINDTVAIETLKQLRAECRLSPANDAVALEVICTPVGKLTVPQIEFARRMTEQRELGLLVNWVNKDKADKADNVWADLEDRIDCLETQQHELSSNVEEVRSDLDRAINCIRDAAAELASI
jgi:hypothetical protein